MSKGIVILQTINQSLAVQLLESDSKKAVIRKVKRKKIKSQTKQSISRCKLPIILSKEH